MPAVKMPAELHDLGFAGVRPCDPQRQVGGLRAGGSEADRLRARRHVANEARPFDLQIMAGAEMGTARDLLLDRLDDRGMTMPQDQSSVSAEVVDIFVPVDVPFPRSFGV